MSMEVEVVEHARDMTRTRMLSHLKIIFVSMF